MNLHEYQAKFILNKYKLPVPLGYIFEKPDDARKFALKIGNGPWVMKCQIHAGGRGKAGGIFTANSLNEVDQFSNQWLGKYIITNQTGNQGKLVKKILIESFIKITKEMYIAILIDNSIQEIIFIASKKGGENVETILHQDPSMIHKIIINPYYGPQEYQARSLAFKLDLKNEQILQFTEIFLKLTDIFLNYDLKLIEINPLSIKLDGSLICLDSKIILDDNAIFRQNQIKKIIDFDQLNVLERQAINFGLNYVALEGNIGCIVNGAGLAMTTMDMIDYYGGKAANFLDIGGNVSENAIEESLKIVLSNKRVKIVLVNIFGGIVRCDLIARGIFNSISELKNNIPIIIRLEGNNADLGIKFLMNKNIPNIMTFNNLIKAIKKSVSLSKEVICQY